MEKGVSQMFEKEMITISKNEFNNLVEQKAKIMAIKAVIKTQTYPDKQIAEILEIDVEEE